MNEINNNRSGQYPESMEDEVEHPNQMIKVSSERLK